MGSYIHGMFNNDCFRSFFIKKFLGTNSKINYQKELNKNLDEFSNFIQKKTKIEELLTL